MANPYYIPTGPSVGERVANVANEYQKIKQMGELGTEHNRLMGEDIALRGKGQDIESLKLLETQKKREAETPRSRMPFDTNSKQALTMAMDKLDPLNVLKDVKKEFDFFESIGADRGHVYANYGQQAWPETQKRIVNAFREVAMNPETPNAYRQWYTEKADQVEKDKTGKTIDMFFPQVAMEWQAAQAEMLSKLPQGNAPKVVGRSLVDPNSGQVIYRDPDAIEKTKTPNDLLEFEMFTYGKEMPQLRGTPEYKDAMIGYMKSKRDATVAPSKSDPAVLRKEFIGQSKDFVTIRDSYNRIKASVDKPSPAGDLALIFNYMKMLDPGSVVRESEFATAAASGSYGERIKAAVGKVMKGEKLSDAMRTDFVDRSNKLYKSQLGSHEKLKGEYDRISTGLGVEPSSVIIDYLTEQNDIQNEKYDIGEVYVGQDGTSRIYKGKDSTGKHVWIQVQ